MSDPRLKRKVVRSSLLLLALLAPFIIWRLLLLGNIHRQLAKIRAAGEPANVQELNAWYRTVPANQNAALVLTQAFSLCDLRTARKLISDFKLPPRGRHIGPERTEAIQDQLSEHSAALEKVDQALQLPASRYPIDLSLGPSTPLPHLAYLKRFAVLNQCQAMLAIDAGRPDDSLTNIIAILRLAKTLDDEPILISQLVRLNLINLGVATLERTLNAQPVSGVTLTNLLVALSGSGKIGETLTRALVGERAYMASMFTLSRQEAERVFGPAKDEDADHNFPRRRSTALVLAGFYDLDRGFFLYAMGKGIERADYPPPEILRIGNYLTRAGEKAKDRCYLVSSSMAIYGPSLPRFADTDANLKLALTAVAIEQFRHEQGHLPEKLEELEPKFVEEVPADPFDGQPIRYRRLTKGYVLYSIGRDRQDNGGKELPPSRQSSNKTGFDITFTVER